MIVPAIEKKEKVINSSKNKLLGFEGFIFCILWEFPAYAALFDFCIHSAIRLFQDRGVTAQQGDTKFILPAGIG